MTVPFMLGLAALAGFGIGHAYARMLKRSVDLFAGRGTALHVAALTACRLALVIAFFVTAAHLGAFGLLAGFLGFFIARTLALRAGAKVA